MPNWTIGRDAAALHRRALVWDNHVCIPRDDPAAFLPGLYRLRNAGVTMMHLNIADAQDSLDSAVRQASIMRHWIRRHEDDFRLVETVTDIEAIRKDGKTGVSFDVEGAFAVGPDLPVIGLLYDIGVRWLLMVYNVENLVGYGCHDAEDLGLKEFGYEFIAEMDRVGMIKDLSHTGYKTARDVIDASDKPVTFSHSNPRALCDHPRNIPDDLIVACARKGGVVGLNGVGLFLGDNDVSTDRFLDHVDYVSDLASPEHAGIGSDYCDFDPGALDRILAAMRHIWPEHLGYRPGMKFMEPEQFPEITEGLMKRGYSETHIRGILGENFLRVARQTWTSRGTLF